MTADTRLAFNPGDRKAEDKFLDDAYVWLKGKPDPAPPGTLPGAAGMVERCAQQLPLGAKMTAACKWPPEVPVHQDIEWPQYHPFVPTPAGQSAAGPHDECEKMWGWHAGYDDGCREQAATLEMLRADLERYGRHDPNCESIAVGEPGTEWDDCTCGFAAAPRGTETPAKEGT